STPEAYRKLLDDARSQKENAERLLAEKSAAFRQDQIRAQTGVNDISALLPQGTALLAYVRYDRYVLHWSATGKGPPAPVPSYAAFVLQAGKHEPEFVQLGSAREIDHSLEAWRQTIAQQAVVADGSGKAIEDVCRRAGAALRRKIWDPVVPLAANAREVLALPEGGLPLVNLAALPVANQ